MRGTREMRRRKQRIYNIVLIASLALLVGLASAFVTKAAFKHRAAKETQDQMADGNTAADSRGTSEEPAVTRGPEDVNIAELPANAPGELVITEISNVTASRELVLSWTRCPGAFAYQIARRDNATGAYEKLALVDAAETSYADTGRVGGEIYSYQVFALDEDYYVTDYSAQVSQLAIDADRKMIALTYDDGPSNNTPTVLDAAEKYNAHVTFFIVGERLGSYQDFLRREAEQGLSLIHI